jgi:hypothetical protein
MRNKFFFVSALLALTVAAFWCDGATAGSLKGYVRDRGKKPPANGISGARVSLRRPGGDQTDPVITDTDGQYHVVNVGNAEYTVVVFKVGYIPRPHEQTKIKVKGDTEADDILLVQGYGTDVYYSELATNILKNVAEAPKDSQRKVFIYEWDNLRAINLPPSSKARLSGELDKQNGSAKEVLPNLEAYLAASPEEIMKVQTVFGDALGGKSSLPGKYSLGDLKLSDEIVADVVLFQIKSSTESEEKRKTFVKEFLLKWDGTTASKRFLDIQEQDLDKSPLNKPPW